MWINRICNGTSEGMDQQYVIVPQVKAWSWTNSMSRGPLGCQEWFSMSRGPLGGREWNYVSITVGVPVIV